MELTVSDSQQIILSALIILPQILVQRHVGEYERIIRKVYLSGEDLQVSSSYSVKNTLQAGQDSL